MLSRSCCLFCRKSKKPKKVVEDVLVVIDVQPWLFSAARNKKVLDVICHELQDAMKNDRYIVFLRLFFCGKTHEQLQKIVAGYDKVIHTFKWASNDGSMTVLNALENNNISPKSFRVCGINTDICVFATVHGLREKISNFIRIISDGCYSFTPTQHERGLRWLSTIPNIRIEQLDLLTPQEFKEVTDNVISLGLFAESKFTERDHITSTILEYLNNQHSTEEDPQSLTENTRLLMPS